MIINQFYYVILTIFRYAAISSFLFLRPFVLSYFIVQSLKPLINLLFYLFEQIAYFHFFMFLFFPEYYFI